MKKILSLFLIILIALNSIPVFAESEETENNIQSAETQPEIVTNDNSLDFKSEIRAYLDSRLLATKEYLSESKGPFGLFYKSPAHTIREAYLFDENSYEISLDKQKEIVYQFVEKLFDMLVEGAVESTLTVEEKNTIIKEKISKNSYLDISGREINIEISDNHWYYNTPTYYYYHGNVNNPPSWDGEYAVFYDLTNIEEIIDYVTNAHKKELHFMKIRAGWFGNDAPYDFTKEDQVRATADYENQMLNYVELSSKYKLLDKLSFNITLDESWRDSPLEEIAGPNGTVKCTIENLHTGRMHLVLTFEGKYGKKQYFQMDIVTGFSTSSRWLYFTTDSVVEDNKFIQLKARRGFSNDVIFFSGGYNNLTLSWYYHSEGQGGYSISDKGIEPRYGHPQIIESPNPLKCTDMKYEFYGSEKSFEGNNNLNRYLSLPASYEEYAASLGIELEDEEEQSEEQQEEKQEEKEAELKEEQAEKTNEELAKELHSLGLLEGTGEGYELEKSFTREQAAAIIVRFIGEEENVLNSEYNEAFSDVAKESWSYPYIMYCYENGITKGTGNGKFSPEDEIPATQFITLILRLLGHTQAEPKTAFDLAVEHKLLDLEKANELKEKKEFLRGDMVYVMYQTLGK